MAVNQTRFPTFYGKNQFNNSFAPVSIQSKTHSRQNASVSEGLLNKTDLQLAHMANDSSKMNWSIFSFLCERSIDFLYSLEYHEVNWQDEVNKCCHKIEEQIELTLQLVKSDLIRNGSQFADQFKDYVTRKATFRWEHSWCIRFSRNELKPNLTFFSIFVWISAFPANWISSWVGF